MLTQIKWNHPIMMMVIATIVSICSFYYAANAHADEWVSVPSNMEPNMYGSYYYDYETRLPTSDAENWNGSDIETCNFSCLNLKRQVTKHGKRSKVFIKLYKPVGATNISGTYNYADAETGNISTSNYRWNGKGRLPLFRWDTYGHKPPVLMRLQNVNVSAYSADHPAYVSSCLEPDNCASGGMKSKKD